LQRKSAADRRSAVFFAMTQARPGLAASPRAAMAGVVLATMLGAWLRMFRIGRQVVLDDEWHAIHKLMNASAYDILRTFGLADHSIPLTLFYKALAATVGLTEIDMRAVQVLCGIATVAVVGWLAWRVTRDAWVATLSAILVAAAPFHVLYSRIARPYAITTLLAVVTLAAVWRWRGKRGRGLAAAICAMAALSAWLHPLSALFPAFALVFVAILDLRAQPAQRARLLRSSLLLGACAAASMALILAWPLLHDFGSLQAKARLNSPSAYTLFRVASLFAGGFDDRVTPFIVLLAAFGAWKFQRARPALGGYLLFLSMVPVLVVLLLGAAWTHQGHTFARYIFPVQMLFLCSAAYGAIWLAGLPPLARPWAPAAAAAVLAAAYLAFNPAISQVRTLGPWFGHIYHQFDYGPEHNRSRAYFATWEVPQFYRTLGQSPPGSVPIIEAPFRFEAPYNPFAYYATVHHQPELMGFLHDTCYAGPFLGEVPRDPRFRFRNFVFLDDRASVLASPARYIAFNRSLVEEPLSGKCLAALTRLYGEPARMDRQVAVFDLDRARRGSGL
jgi:hypothetical protein